jgi:hypothetical protein
MIDLLFIWEIGVTDCPLAAILGSLYKPQRPVFRERPGGAQRETEMEQFILYKGYRIRAYEDWSGLWLAETKKPLRLRPGVDHDDTDAEYITTPSGHPTPEAAINFIKQMIDKQMIDEDALARLTRRGGEEIIETLYGINPKTFEVETVSLHRGGELRKLGKDVEPRTHHVAHARDPKSEVRISFGLTNVFSVPQALVDQESTKKRVEELRKRAAEMKEGKI